MRLSSCARSAGPPPAAARRKPRRSEPPERRPARRGFHLLSAHRPSLLQSRPRCGIFRPQWPPGFLRFCFLISSLIAPIGLAATQNRHPRPERRAQAFERLCSRCHGADGQGGEMGPAIVTRTACARTRAGRRSFATASRATACRRFACDRRRLRPLVAFIRTLRPRRADDARTRHGGSTDGEHARRRRAQSIGCRLNC